MFTQPHRRYNPLLAQHILVSPHRASRPWQGQTEPPQASSLPSYDPQCYLCPGNPRSSGAFVNEKYTSTWSFPNDFAAVKSAGDPEAHSDGVFGEAGVFGEGEGLFKAESATGCCDVVCFSPRHDLTIAKMNVDDIEKIVEEWCRIYVRRGSESGIRYVQIFENKGAMMGCSNPHPHGQVWSLSCVPTLPAEELKNMKKWSESKRSTAPPQSDSETGLKHDCLLCTYAAQELLEQAKKPEEQTRIVCMNDDFMALVPWWATWPFEVMILPHKKHHASLLSLSLTEKRSLADIINRMTRRYDNLFKCSFAYSMGIHQRPVPSASELSSLGIVPQPKAPSPSADSDADLGEFAHFHMHFSPPLLRSASVKKFLVGFELMAEAQRDLTPEQAASRLRACDEKVHYLDVLEGGEEKA